MEVAFFYYVDSRDQTHVIKLASKGLSPTEPSQRLCTFK